MTDLSASTQRRRWQAENKMMEGKRGGERLHGQKYKFAGCDLGKMYEPGRWIADRHLSSTSPLLLTHLEIRSIETGQAWRCQGCCHQQHLDHFGGVSTVVVIYIYTEQRRMWSRHALVIMEKCHWEIIKCQPIIICLFLVAKTLEEFLNHK